MHEHVDAVQIALEVTEHGGHDRPYRFVAPDVLIRGPPRKGVRHVLLVLIEKTNTRMKEF